MHRSRTESGRQFTEVLIKYTPATCCCYCVYRASRCWWPKSARRRRLEVCAFRSKVVDVYRDTCISIIRYRHEPIHDKVRQCFKNRSKRIQCFADTSHHRELESVDNANLCPPFAPHWLLLGEPPVHDYFIRSNRFCIHCWGTCEHTEVTTVNFAKKHVDKPRHVHVSEVYRPVQVQAAHTHENTRIQCTYG